MNMYVLLSVRQREASGRASQPESSHFSQWAHLERTCDRLGQDTLDGHADVGPGNDAVWTDGQCLQVHHGTGSPAPVPADSGHRLHLQHVQHRQADLPWWTGSHTGEAEKCARFSFCTIMLILVISALAGFFFFSSFPFRVCTF